MNWLASIGVGLCAAPLVGIICGTAALVCAEWVRMPQREGAAGYFALGMTLLGTLAGLVAGIGFARGWFGTQPGFGRSFGLTIASFTAIASIIAAIVWTTSDRPPKLQGRPLDLSVELRCPPGTALPDKATGHTPYVTLVRLSSGKSIGHASLELDRAREIEGRLTVPALLRIESSASRKLLNIRFSEQHDLLFALDFGSQPSERNFEWSDWIEAAQRAGQPRPRPDQSFHVRYQVQLVPEPPPPVTREQAEAAADAKEEAAMWALASNAPLSQWLVFTRYGVPQSRIDAAIASIHARPAFASEMVHEILHGENESNRDALRALEHFRPAPTELAAGVAEFGRDIAHRLRELESMQGSEEQLNQRGADISTRFSAWMVATRALHGHDDISFVQELQEILVLARKHERSYVLQIDVVRVASYYLQQWAGIEPLPTDPPPR